MKTAFYAKLHRKLRRGFTLMELMFVVSALAVLVVVLYPVYQRSSGESYRDSCFSNLKQIGLAVAQYAQDNAERFPLASVNNKGYSQDSPYNQPYGWADAIFPYLRTIVVMHCPSESSSVSRNPSQSGFTDYFYNHNLSGVERFTIECWGCTVMASDGNDGLDKTDARYSKTDLPVSWRKDRSSPSWRHVGAGRDSSVNILFADGHCKAPHENAFTAKPKTWATFSLHGGHHH